MSQPRHAIKARLAKVHFNEILKKKNIDSYQIKYEENGTYEPYTYTGHVTYVNLMKGLARIKKKPNIDKRNYVIVIFAAF